MGDGGGNCKGRVGGRGRCLEVEEALFAWEEESVTECSALLQNIVLQENILNRWRWILDPINGYFVKETYQYLTMMDAPPEWGLLDVVWQKQALLKVSVFAWRLIHNRLPTKNNIARRRVIHQMTTCVLEGADPSRPRYIFYSDVTLSTTCVIWFTSGLTFLF